MDETEDAREREKQLPIDIPCQKLLGKSPISCLSPPVSRRSQVWNRHSNLRTCAVWLVDRKQTPEDWQKRVQAVRQQVRHHGMPPRCTSEQE